MTYEQLVIFDCDGTLVDTEQLHARALVSCLEHHGVTYTPERFLSSYQGLACERIIREINMRYGTHIQQDAVDRMHVAEMRKFIPLYMQVKDDSVDFVRVLSQRGKTGIAVGSNGNRDIVLASLAHAGFLDYIGEENVFVAAQVAAPKPAPDLYLSLAARFGVAPEKCIVIEDSANGALAGVAAGMRTLGYMGLAHDENAQKQALENAGVHSIINTLGEIEHYLFH